MAVGSKG